MHLHSGAPISDRAYLQINLATTLLEGAVKLDNPSRPPQLTTLLFLLRIAGEKRHEGVQGH
jgi:hypothetical protein